MKNKFDRYVSDAINHQCMVDACLGEIFRMFKFKDFEYEPTISMCGGCEIILEYRGYEMHIDKAFEVMQQKGYIEPSDIYYGLRFSCPYI